MYIFINLVLSAHPSRRLEGTYFCTLLHQTLVFNGVAMGSGCCNRGLLLRCGGKSWPCTLSQLKKLLFIALRRNCHRWRLFRLNHLLSWMMLDFLQRQVAPLKGTLLLWRRLQGTIFLSVQNWVPGFHILSRSPGKQDFVRAGALVRSVWLLLHGAQNYWQLLLFVAADLKSVRFRSRKPRITFEQNQLLPLNHDRLILNRLPLFYLLQIGAGDWCSAWIRELQVLIMSKLRRVGSGSAAVFVLAQGMTLVAARLHSFPNQIGHGHWLSQLLLDLVFRLLQTRIYF